MGSFRDNVIKFRDQLPEWIQLSLEYLWAGIGNRVSVSTTFIVGSILGLIDRSEPPFWKEGSWLWEYPKNIVILAGALIVGFTVQFMAWIKTKSELDDKTLEATATTNDLAKMITMHADLERKCQDKDSLLKSKEVEITLLRETISEKQNSISSLTFIADDYKSRFGELEAKHGFTDLSARLVACRLTEPGHTVPAIPNRRHSYFIPGSTGDYLAIEIRNTGNKAIDSLFGLALDNDSSNTLPAHWEDKLLPSVSDTVALAINQAKNLIVARWTADGWIAMPEARNSAGADFLVPPSRIMETPAGSDSPIPIFFYPIETTLHHPKLRLQIRAHFTAAGLNIEFLGVAADLESIKNGVEMKRISSKFS